MAQLGASKAQCYAVDAALSEWRQGDCVVSERWFVFHFDPEQPPLTPASDDVAAGGTDLAESDVRGLVVLTQTCDVVRSCRERPFLEVAPLVELGDEDLRKIERERRPRYACLGGVAERHLVADLDRMMTVDKAVVAEWERTLGYRDDEEARALRQALARKRARIVFPDDFVAVTEKLQNCLQSKHNKESSEGRALRALRAIRVRAAPSCEAVRVEVFFWFIRDEDESDLQGENWASYFEAWLKLVKPSERFAMQGQIATLAYMTALDYVESDPLDFDHPSQRACKPFCRERGPCHAMTSFRL